MTGSAQVESLLAAHHDQNGTSLSTLASDAPLLLVFLRHAG